jgi:hypothetical protein
MPSPSAALALVVTGKRNRKMIELSGWKANKQH